ncbi:MAG: tRNA (adenosine(37)-N6)-threonylcarbamoyltransferase complex transferase subunit TsaD [Alphaproteobacteria bacterium]|nr:tRNA (adenosine(37)-N6)-threonylcarbamoyltransferase complex transferase subunit TsaD [Alphaproteobacteria bacterium]
MKILGIESSCDETAIAVLDDNKKNYCDEVFSQINLHQLYGGVVPEIAARSHLEIIHDFTKTSLESHNINLNQLDAIAVTSGPGLIGGLMIGVNFAQTLAHLLNIPCYGINHLEGHALCVRLSDDVAFPYLVLLASGGHCQILAVRNVGDYVLYGQTLDDSAGETFDKIAHLLGLAYPGGPEIEKIAQYADDVITLPKPLTNQQNCDFSFSGLKSAIRRKILAEKADAQKSGRESLSKQKIANFAFSLQQNIADIFANRLTHALARFNDDFNIKNPIIALVGGVASNRVIRQKLSDFCEVQQVHLVCPPQNLCTDNAAMIAWAGIERIKANNANTDLTLYPRNPLCQ